MIAVAVTGLKKSGKTSLMGLVAEALEGRGKTVAILKYSYHAVERNNTDTFWLMRPGRTVAGASPEETAVFWSRPLSFRELVSMLRADVLLVEGGTNLRKLPRILCLRDGTEEEMEALAPGFKHNAGYILASVGSTPARADMPHFAEATPEASDVLASLILEKGLKLPEPGQQGLSNPAGGGSLPPNKQETAGFFLLQADGEEMVLPAPLEHVLQSTVRTLLGTVRELGPGKEVLIRLKL